MISVLSLNSWVMILVGPGKKVEEGGISKLRECSRILIPPPTLLLLVVFYHHTVFTAFKGGRKENKKEFFRILQT